MHVWPKLTVWAWATRCGLESCAEWHVWCACHWPTSQVCWRAGGHAGVGLLRALGHRVGGLGWDACVDDGAEVGKHAHDVARACAHA